MQFFGFCHRFSLTHILNTPKQYTVQIRILTWKSVVMLDCAKNGFKHNFRTLQTHKYMSVIDVLHHYSVSRFE